MKKPKIRVLVAETRCCGFKVVPTEPIGHPCHGRRASDPPNSDPYVECSIIQVWECEPVRLHGMKADKAMMGGSDVDLSGLAGKEKA